MDRSTEHLIAGLKRGNKEAFDFLYKTYFERLCGYCFRFLSDPDLSQDIVNECFLTLWEKREQIECTSIKAFIFSMVKNKCLNHIKHTKIKDDLISSLPPYFECFDDLDYGELYLDPEQILVQKELENFIDEIIESLPEQSKKVYLLNRHEGLKNKEIAGKLNLSIKTVEMHMTRALSTLNRQMKKYNSHL